MGAAVKRACACVVGWHYPPEMYHALARQKDLDVFVVSHRPRQRVPDWVYTSVPRERVWVEPNLGYDWGAYQQFLERPAYREYEFVFLLHDDLVIHDDGWVDAAIDVLERGVRFVGNATNGEETAHPRLTPWCYAPFAWKPPSLGFRHQTVRGSFVATTSSALTEAGCFQVFWDWLHLTEGFGNWSLRATCGKLQALFGDACFGYLSEEYRQSSFVTELVRGGRGRRSFAATGRWRRLVDRDWLRLSLVDLHRGVCARYMDAFMAGDRTTCRRLWPLVVLPARRFGH